MIRSSKLSIKFSNKQKLENVNIFINEYQKVVKEFVETFWNIEKIPVLFSKQTIPKINTWLSKRALQCAGKQASGIIRGTRKKQEKRKYVIEKFIKEKQFKKARKLQYVYDRIKVSMPKIENVCPELDKRFVKQNFDNTTSFDGWITLSSLGNKLKIQIPVKKTKHFNKINSVGIRLKGIRLSRKWIAFNFEIPDVEKKLEGKVLGIDIGKTTVLSCSNLITSKEDIHEWTLDKIIDKLARKKKGSKAFERAQSHRKNHINWAVNQLNFNGVRRVNRENIKGLRWKKKVSRKLSHWTYTDIFDKLDSKCEELGVQVCTMNPTYTSQRCSECGWVRRDNRKGKKFKCTACGYIQDADLNASLNLSLNLSEISKKERLKQKNRKGFYWTVLSQENIVPDTQKA